MLAVLCSWGQGLQLMSRQFGNLCARFSGAGRALLRCRAYAAWKVLLRGQTDEVEAEKGPPLLQQLRDKVCRPKSALQDQWDEAGVESVDLVVRGISGEVVLEECNARSRTPIQKLVQQIRAALDMEVELVQLCVGTTVLKHSAFLGDYLAPSHDHEGTMELTFLKLHGPAVTVQAKTGREIKLMDVPTRGEKCHFDRGYRFLSLGGFSEKPSMRYIMASNDDKATRSDETMWRLNVRMPVVVYLNFRSEFHVLCARPWLDQGAWEPSSMESTVSTGIPNGPYSGPVFQKAVGNGILDLYGSECGEGTYFVFVDVQPNS